MTDINGKAMYCRTTEEKIVRAFLDGVNRKISMRDSIINKSDSVFSHTVYRLWNTDLVKRFEGEVWIYIASNIEERDRYWQPNGFSTWQPRDYVISNTTKSRLNVFLNYYGFNSLEVHSSKKLFGVWYNKKELETDSWYKLDFTSHELVKVN